MNEGSVAVFKSNTDLSAENILPVVKMPHLFEYKPCPTLTIVNVAIISLTADPCHSKEPTRMLLGNSQALLPRF